jgi:hypothetical protein
VTANPVDSAKAQSNALARADVELTLETTLPTIWRPPMKASRIRGARHNRRQKRQMKANRSPRPNRGGGKEIVWLATRPIVVAIVAAPYRRAS